MRKSLIPFAAALVLAFSCEKAPEEIAVTGVSINRTTAELTVGETVQLSATVKPSDATNQSISWTSSNTGVATVTDNGLVTAIAEGRATIKASAEGKSTKCVVTVSKKIIAVSSVTLDKDAISLTKGESITLVATVSPDDATNKSVSWTSANSGVVSVNSNGKVTAIAPGSATVTAEADNQKATCVVTVTIPVESVTLNKTDLTLNIGQSETLIATVRPDDATDNTVSWVSSDTNVATVSSNGKVIAVDGGQTTVIAKAGDKQATCVITVIKKVTSITLDKESLTVSVGNTTTLTATVLPEDATYKAITWKSSNPNIATVENGVVKGIGFGKATITASSGKVSASCTVFVIIDSAEGVFAEEFDENRQIIDNVVQPGSELKFGVVNYSSETIHVVSLQLIDGLTGTCDYVLSPNSEIPSCSSESWTITIGASGIYLPVARFVYTFKGESYTLEILTAPVPRAPVLP